MDLPQPDSPTRPKRLTAFDIKRNTIHCANCANLRLKHAAIDRKMHFQDFQPKQNIIVHQYSLAISPRFGIHPASHTMFRSEHFQGPDFLSSIVPWPTCNAAQTDRMLVFDKGSAASLQWNITFCVRLRSTRGRLSIKPSV